MFLTKGNINWNQTLTKFESRKHFHKLGKQLVLRDMLKIILNGHKNHQHSL